MKTSTRPTTAAPADAVTVKEGRTSADKIDEMVRRIVERFAPEQIILFGSHARGTARSDSDVDLLVVMSVAGSKREKQIELRCALHDISVAKDIVVATPEEVERRRNIVGTIIRIALREGKVLYDRGR
jgi:predicted nucleotidyltransferase